ncbi:GNAT family N-acetyltransferase [Streptomyces albofaciens JCM 4342]|uniref:GNAT family N-acetyltransferase n=1 Tax=Streptomyces albofaciens TaxID=66866 RepID=UPI00123B965E|nr:GNAT family N-acyltransferase [Streptomyces albofaciens]KAA6222746.1 GNAT family N-acetyltransferase [Streptomyces albofaciens JCM 4342]
MLPTASPAPAPTTAPAAARPAAPAPPDGRPAYVTSLAETPAQIRAAQRLRYAVFAEEMGATLPTPLPGHDMDDFDDLADHLVVTETATGEVVGTYRLLPPGRTERSYSATEFDLRALHGLRAGTVEAGRSCVHPRHRSGAVVNQMWAALARYVTLSGHRYLAGCASVPLDDGGRAAADAWLLGSTRHASPPDLRVHPRRPWIAQPPDARAPRAGAPDGERAGGPSYARLPPLLRGYLRIGAWMCGAPAHDPEFGVADFFVLLDMERLNDRYRRFFLGESR